MSASDTTTAPDSGTATGAASAPTASASCPFAALAAEHAPNPHRPAAAPVRRSGADRVMHRLLGLDPDAPRGSAAGARQAFQTSIMISAARCVVMYIVLPFVLPLIGVTKGVGPVVGLIISVLAMVSITFSMRRFFRADHPKRWWYAALGGAVFAFMAVSAVIDIVDLAN